MHPLDALKAQIGERLKAPLKSSYLKIEPPKSLGGLKTLVTVSVDKSRTPLNLWDRVGTHDFTYDRIDLNAFTSGLNKTVKAITPITGDSVLRNIFFPYAIPIASNDLVPSMFLSFGPIDILAGELSWRWVGEMRATLAMAGIEIGHLIAVDRYTFSFNTEYRSADVKGRLVTYLNMGNADRLPTPVTSAMMVLGNPTMNGPDENGDNTSITMTFTGAPYVGTITVFYGRRSFPRTFRYSVKLKGPRKTNHTDLAKMLGDELGCDIEPSDIRPEPFPSNAVGKNKLVVFFDDNSLAYVGPVLVEYTVTT
jgi:hypothetical protein